MVSSPAAYVYRGGSAPQRPPLSVSAPVPAVARVKALLPPRTVTGELIVAEGAFVVIVDPGVEVHGAAGGNGVGALVLLKVIPVGLTSWLSVTTPPVP